MLLRRWQRSPDVVTSSSTRHESGTLAVVCLGFSPKFSAQKHFFHLSKVEYFYNCSALVSGETEALRTSWRSSSFAMISLNFKFSILNWKLAARWAFDKHSERKLFHEKRFCQHIASTCCRHHPASHHTMNYFYNFKYGKLFSSSVVLWSELLANRRSRENSVKRKLWMEHLANTRSTIMLETVWRNRGNLFSLLVTENKLFVMTFKCLQFISFSAVVEGCTVMVCVWETSQVPLSSSIILWFKFPMKMLNS